MTFTLVLTTIATLIALGVAITTLFSLARLPLNRDHRPLAPVVALALAYAVLKLRVLLGLPEVAEGVRELAWLIWHCVCLLEMGFLAYSHLRCRYRCPIPPPIQR